MLILSLKIPLGNDVFIIDDQPYVWRDEDQSKLVLNSIEFVVPLLKFAEFWQFDSKNSDEMKKVEIPIVNGFKTVVLDEPSILVKLEVKYIRKPTRANTAHSPT